MEIKESYFCLVISIEIILEESTKAINQSVSEASLSINFVVASICFQNNDITACKHYGNFRFDNPML